MLLLEVLGLVLLDGSGGSFGGLHGRRRERWEVRVARRSWISGMGGSAFGSGW